MRRPSLGCGHPDRLVGKIRNLPRRTGSTRHARLSRRNTCGRIAKVTRMSAPGKLVRSSRWKSGPSKEQRPLGSECCAATGDSGCETYKAIAWGVGLSHERSDIAGAEGFHSLEGNMCGTAMRGADALPGSKATSRAKGSYRNLGDLMACRRRHVLYDHGGPHREGEEPEADDARTREVGPRHSSNEAG